MIWKCKILDPNASAHAAALELNSCAGFDIDGMASNTGFKRLQPHFILISYDPFKFSVTNFLDITFKVIISFQF